MSAEAEPSVTVTDVELDAELTSTGLVASADEAEYALRIGDDSLILAQQLGWWISRAPELEEDLALGNIALDLLGHARNLLHFAGTALGKTEDELAYFRDEHEFRSAWLFEQPNGDFGHTIARGLLTSSYQFELYTQLAASTSPGLAGIAAKSVKEVAYHRDHAVQWTLRLAGGTDESRSRIERALINTWPYLDELFRDDELHDRFDAAPRPSALREPVMSVLRQVLAEAELDEPKTAESSGDGRHGQHSTYLGPILAEMQVLARRHPGASW
ncbi:MAG: 1,2-phenylacetyl-CoA epoxidase subunit PaaC [Agrococcus casei]|uniref:1,2-phenylacetyl-CoA epoxidase subunit PaaC n=2 Tax=Agrococcus casei TaxID=343512 RepID=UPI003F930F69